MKKRGGRGIIVAVALLSFAAPVAISGASADSDPLLEVPACTPQPLSPGNVCNTDPVDCVAWAIAVVLSDDCDRAVQAELRYVDTTTAPADEPLALGGDKADDGTLSPVSHCVVGGHGLVDKTAIDAIRNARAGAAPGPVAMPAATSCGGGGSGGTTYYKTGGTWKAPVSGNYNHKFENWMFWERCVDSSYQDGYATCEGATYLTTKSGNYIEGGAYSASGSGGDRTWIGSNFARKASRPYCDGSLATGAGDAYGYCYYRYG